MRLDANKPLAPQLALMPTAAARGRARSDVLARVGAAAWESADLGAPKSLAWVSRGITFTLTQPPHLRANGWLEVWVTAKRGGKPLPLENVDSFLFANPPVMAPDGTTSPVQNPMTGEWEQRPNFRENPLEALKIIICDAVLAEARKQGWRG